MGGGSGERECLEIYLHPSPLFRSWGCGRVNVNSVNMWYLYKHIHNTHNKKRIIVKQSHM